MRRLPHVRYTRLWTALILVILLSFGVLGYYGREIYLQAPPIPQRVVTSTGTLLFTGQDIKDGQSAWQSMGGQEVGTVWGHGAYVAPDWSADWLHREATLLLDRWGQAAFGQPYAKVSDEQQATLKARLVREMRTNTYNPSSGDLVVSPDRAAAVAANSAYYTGLFGNAPELNALRDAYAIRTNTLTDPARLRTLNAFFFWASWACVTNRPGSSVSYTNNWPSEALVENRATGSIVVWSVISFVLLLAGIGALAWYHAVLQGSHPEEIPSPPVEDPLTGLDATPSMRATRKFFWVVILLAVAQAGLGAITAHYGVEGSAFYGIPLANWLPYSITRTWHTQLGIFWIATAWLATGLFVAPAVSGKEPVFQRAGVNFLFLALLIIVVGSMVGELLAIHGKMDLVRNFWFGHMGYEYVDLARFWQIFLFIGLFLWLFLMSRAMWPAFRKPGEANLLGLFLLSSFAIALLYGSALMWGRQTNLAIAEYWRWWVVHLWVEGFFEVFATVVIAFLFTRMGLLKTAVATGSVLFSTTIFLAGGIIGTFHHLYFTGTPTAVLAFGATFSALEVVPLVLIGFEGYENFLHSRRASWVQEYRWPIYFFVSVAFWNLLGAGVFGFLINPPIALYYMQGLNTTPVHGHTALFGVYGMLGFGLMLFCLKGLTVRRRWRTDVLRFSFWAINIGLLLMVLISILPIGLMQTWASVEHGLWYARSAEFLHSPGMNTLRWLRVIGDTIYTIGIFALGWFVLGLSTGWSLEDEPSALQGGVPAR
ncbi:MAG: nitric-oxide reductase large subunit [Mycobacterium leprae]